jgi:hypothetical protein
MILAETFIKYTNSSKYRENWYQTHIDNIVKHHGFHVHVFLKCIAYREMETSMIAYREIETSMRCDWTVRFGISICWLKYQHSPNGVLITDDGAAYEFLFVTYDDLFKPGIILPVLACINWLLHHYCPAVIWTWTVVAEWLHQLCSSSRWKVWIWRPTVQSWSDFTQYLYSYDSIALGL